MEALYKIKASEELADIAAEVAEELGISKTLALTLVKNTLLYNVVRNEIKGQAAFLLGRDYDPESGEWR